MLWADFGYSIYPNLITLDGDQKSACGSVTIRVKCGVCQDLLLTLLQPGDIFIHDDAPVHTARNVRTSTQ